MERRKRRKEKRELGREINLYLCFCFQTDLAVCYFHGVLHGVAAILFADLLGLPLNKVWKLLKLASAAMPLFRRASATASNSALTVSFSWAGSEQAIAKGLSAFF